MSLPVGLLHPTLGPLHPALLLSRLPTGWGLGEWYAWSLRDIKSGLLWRVNPGRDSDLREGERKAQAKTTREGGWQGPKSWRELGVPVYKLSLCVGLTSASSVCIILGFVIIALRCRGPSGRFGRVQTVGAHLLSLGWYTCQALPLTEALVKVKAAVASPAHEVS